MEESFNKSVKETAKHWWIPVLVGIAMIGFSIWIVLTPLTSYLSLSILFSIMLTISEIAEVAFAINNRQIVNE